MQKYALKLLQKIYLHLTTTEKKFFDTFDFLKYSAKAKIISVGNLTVGGTGKTPVLFELLNYYKNKKTVVISRGYKSKYEKSFYILHGKNNHINDITDEALLLNKKFEQIPLLLGKNRHHSAIMAEIFFKPQYILLDDGFQYRRLKTNVNLVLFDATASLNSAALLPVGRLREPLTRLKDADAILLTRCEQANANQINLWLNKLQPYLKKTTPVIKLKTIIKGFIDANNNSVKPKSNNCLAFAAIGNPQSFFKQLESINLKIKQQAVFKDHYKFKNHELNELVIKAEKMQTQLICTEKDLIKINTNFALKNNIIALKIGVVTLDNCSVYNKLAELNIL